MIKKRILKNYRKFGVEPSPELLGYATLCDKYSEDQLDPQGLQHALCIYLDRVSLRHQALSESISRCKEPPMADTFTESVNMAVDAILNNDLFRGCQLTVSSEKNFAMKDGKYLKPDVGIWRKNSLIYTVECKTNLGYDRGSWKIHFENKTNKYVKNGIKPEGITWLVATESNWAGFPSNDPRTGTNWLCLCHRGSWFGGKNNNSKLAESMNPGVVESIINSIVSVI